MNLKTDFNAKDRSLKIPFLFIILFFASLFAFTQEKYLLIVDVQQQFYQQTIFEKQAKEMVNNINQLLNHFNADHVVYVQAVAANLEISFRGFKVSPVLPAPPLDSTLKIVSSNMFTKIKGDAFSEHSIDSFFRTANAREIVVVGLLAEKCIFSTASGGKEKGYEIYVIAEAIVGKTEGNKEKALKRLSKKGIQLLSINDFLNKAD